MDSLIKSIYFLSKCLMWFIILKLLLLVTVAMIFTKAHAGDFVFGFEGDGFGFRFEIPLKKRRHIRPPPMDDYYDDEYYYRRNKRNWEPKVYREPATRNNIVEYQNNEVPGTILIFSKQKKLLITLNSLEARWYDVSVGKEGFRWSGTERVSKIDYWPAWYPPEEMRQRQPNLPARVSGGPHNPLGAVAIYLGTTLYRIHGTNDPNSIGKAVSSGCFRMHNEDALDLANRVQIGALVKVY